MNEKFLRKFSLSPGNITNCWRGVYYEKKGVEKPSISGEIKKTLDFFRELGEKGSIFQKFVTIDWLTRGVLVSPETWLPENPWNIKGKYDAICQVRGSPTLVEIKGAGDRAFNWYKENNTPLPAHRIQLMTYYLIMREHFPGLATKMLYVNRKTNKAQALDVNFTDEDLADLSKQFEKLHEHLERDVLPAAAPNIEQYLVTGKPAVSMRAITCRYHTMCAGDEHWYQNALGQIPQEMPVDISGD